MSRTKNGLLIEKEVIPMVKSSRKRPYRSVRLEKVKEEELKDAVEGGVVVVGIDVAKEVQYAALMNEESEVLETMKWEQPRQTREFVRFLGRMGASEVQVAMEPSGTYGDALRSELLLAGYEVYGVSPKRVHDAAEVYDGVPSRHDAKAARRCWVDVGARRFHRSAPLAAFWRGGWDE